MKWNAICVGIIAGLTLVLTLVSTPSASEGGGEAWKTGISAKSSGTDRDVTASGAMRVDRDLYALHPYDVNQFGQDEAYNSLDGHSAVRYPFHRER